MHESTPQQAQTPPMRTLVMAVVAPFAAIALLASPLFVDAIRHIAGI
jgi:hypothetical protein